ncbi:Cysteine and histidine-rich domain-containing protein [Zalerion maritima]|uniref:Cysteine and histidine-rich domain-containing protein n=1 Tax=Zalerion maritima TaxID=339359 RepID=A0AAD5WX55_9PEZI|nr:Cysteine and histidine-rich domain-containing protein [Zalerion maritima]
MAQKCVHKGCGKLYTDEDDVCKYHPGPPIFHEGQKGWKCCKPRVLTFEEFMDIPPCTEGKHSTTDLPPGIESKPQTADSALIKKLEGLEPVPSRAPVAAPKQVNTAPPPPPESEDDDPDLEIPDGHICRRKGCGQSYKAGQSREGEQCIHHPGAPIFHEGSKGYSCCKRRVLEFDQFMKIEGCKIKGKHLFVGSGKKENKNETAGSEEILETVRHDFYQTASSVIASLFLKKINKDVAKVEFKPQQLAVDLVTTDSPPKRYKAEIPLYNEIDPEKSTFKIFGTKLEVALAKVDGSSWPVFRSDDRLTGEIYQVGQAGRA